MALIECPECGREVSSSAAACPECAYPVGAGTPSVRRRAVGGSGKHKWWHTAVSVVGRILIGGSLLLISRSGGSEMAIGMLGLFVAGSAIPTWYRHKMGRFKPAGPDTALPDDLADRILDLEHAHREEIAELEERIDFAERLLTKQRERVGPG